MARYDRIARLDPPARGDAFPGWLAVRDLQRDERDKNLGRRARLRFQAARLLRRMASGNGSQSSMELQADAAREELGQLPARDPERELLAALIKAVKSGDRTTAADTAMDLADALLEAGSPFAAEEFFRTSGAINGEDGTEVGSRVEAGIRKAVAAQG